MLVRDVMQPEVRSCRASSSAQEAALMMYAADCGALPVVSDDGALLGVVTDRDLLLAAATRDASLSDIAVEQATSFGTFYCAPEEDIKIVESIMCRHQVRRVPVVDEDNQVVGIVSLSDLARQQSARSTGDPDPDRQVVAAILEAIVQPSNESRVVEKP